MKDARVSTGVRGLDEMLGGGLLPGSANLIAGSPGTGKTTLAIHFVAAAVRAGRNAVFVTFEYLPEQLYRDAEARGIPLRRWESEGKVRLLCTTPELLLAEAEGGDTVLSEAIRDVGARVLVIDSLAHFMFLGRRPDELRQDVAGVMNRLRLLQVTSLLTHEVPDIIGPTMRLSEFGVEFLADTIILLRYVELEGEFQKALNVIKFRGGDHDKHYRQVTLGKEGLAVEAAFDGIEGITGGAARRSMKERARQLI